jgi:Leucine-rich repeat (LRR) protein
MTCFAPFHALRELDISHNGISDVSSLCHLDGLVTLRAAGNAFTHVDMLLELPNLRHLDASFNRIECIQLPPHLLDAGSLRVLCLRGNRLTHVSALPARLEELDLGEWGSGGISANAMMQKRKR